LCGSVVGVASTRTCPDSKTDQINVALDQIILLFNFIQDKDLFHRTYAQLLGSRIINFSSVSHTGRQANRRSGLQTVTL
jgi:hypothetical protein